MAEYFYALCKSYNPKPVMFKDEREITLGIEPESIVVELLALRKTKKKNMQQGYKW